MAWATWKKKGGNKCGPAAVTHRIAEKPSDVIRMGTSLHNFFAESPQSLRFAKCFNDAVSQGLRCSETLRRGLFYEAPFRNTSESMESHGEPIRRPVETASA